MVAKMLIQQGDNIEGEGTGRRVTGHFRQTSRGGFQWLRDDRDIGDVRVVFAMMPHEHRIVHGSPIYAVVDNVVNWLL